MEDDDKNVCLCPAGAQQTVPKWLHARSKYDELGEGEKKRRPSEPACSLNEPSRSKRGKKSKNMYALKV